MQDGEWSMVGAQGRHKHVPSPQRNRTTLNSMPNHNPSHATQAHKAEPCNTVLHDHQISLLALPAAALASIFQHLDSVDGFRLAQTCHACAAEFAHQKAEFRRKLYEELAPTVSRDPPGGAQEAMLHQYWESIGDNPHGTGSNPVSLHLKWEKIPGLALRRLYAISHQPDCVDIVNELWRQAWPEALWSDLLNDGMLDHVETGESPPCICINIAIQVSSDEPLQLPWNWLALHLLYAPAAGFTHWLYVHAPQLQKLSSEYILDAYFRHHHVMNVHIGLHRPAQADQHQLIMSKIMWHTSDFWSGDEDADDTRSVDSYYPDYPTDFVNVKPTFLQRVAITGSWCQALLKACEDLWRAHAGCHVRGMTMGDDIAVDLRELGLDPFAGHISVDSYGDLVLASFKVDSQFKPFTCEDADQSDWNVKRQQAKHQGKVKRVKAAERERLRRMSKT